MKNSKFSIRPGRIFTVSIIQTIAAIILLFFYQSSSAQCTLHAGYSPGSNIYHSDTTYITLSANTSDFSSSATFTWKYSDSVVQTGGSVTRSCTRNNQLYPSLTYTLVVSDPGTGCNDSIVNAIAYPQVFNCSYFISPFWDNFLFSSPFFQHSTFDGGSSGMIIDQMSSTDLIYQTHFHINWGNGRTSDSIVDALVSSSSPYYYSSHIGAYGASGTDTSQSPLYRWGGDYNVSATYFVSYGTMTCPVQSLPILTIRAGGPIAPPLITGSTTYCAGDTLRLHISDTTAYHNLHHLLDTTGSGSIGRYWYSGLVSGTDTPVFVSFFDNNGNRFSFDSIVVIPNLRDIDSGTYYLAIRDDYSGTSHFSPIHITVNGFNVSHTVFSNPSCGINNGSISFSSNSPGDTITVHYTFNSADSIYNTIADATGMFTMTGLPPGRYANFKAFRTSSTCGSNLLPITIDLTPLAAPNVTDSLINVCTGGTVTMHANSAVGGVSYSWTGAGGFTSTMQNPVLTGITSSGDYSVTTHIGSCSSSAAVNVHINVITAVPATPVISSPDSICEQTTTYFSGSPALGTWTSSDTTVLRLFSGGRGQGMSMGAAIITYSISNVCGSNSNTKAIYVKPTPVIGNITGPSVLCVGDTAILRNDSTGGTWRHQNSHFSTRAALDSNTGRIRAISDAFFGVTYAKRATNGCISTKQKLITVGAPKWGGISDRYAGIFPGYSDSLSVLVHGDTITSGNWSVAANPIASVSPHGIVTGLSCGAVTLTYSGANRCGTFYHYSDVKVGDKVNTVIADNVHYHDIESGKGGAIDTGIYGKVNSITFDSARNLYFTEVINGGEGSYLSLYGIYSSEHGDKVFAKVKKVDLAGNITTVAGISGCPNNGGYSGDGGPASNARLRHPKGLAIDRNGNLFICDAANHVIRKVDSHGIISTIAGTYVTSLDATYGVLPVGGYSGDGGPATAARINFPSSITVDSVGNIYFTDQGNNRVRKISTSGIISTFAGNGIDTFSGDGGPATNAGIEGPIGISFDRSGNILVSTWYYNSSLPDRWVQRVRKITPSGIISSVMGATTTNDFEGGSASSYNMHTVKSGLVVGRSGNIYIGTNVVHQIDTSGVINTVVGNYQYTRIISGSSTTNHLSSGTNENWPFSNELYDGFEASNLSMRSTMYGFSGSTAIDDSENIYSAGEGLIYKSGKASLKISVAFSSICAGSADSFRVTEAYNTGNVPKYQWLKNGTVVSSDSIMFTTSALSNNDTIVCVAYDKSRRFIIARSNSIVVHVDSIPNLGIISGPSSICMGSTTTLHDAMAGGIWLSSDTSLATVTAGGVFTAVHTGSVVVTHILSNMCGSDTSAITINIISTPIIGAITGTTTLCVGTTTTLADTTTGGTWSTSAASTASVSSTGIVTGVAAGSATISYSVTNSCGTDVSTASVTINPLPVAGTIIGLDSVCVGSSITLSSPGTIATSSTWYCTTATIVNSDSVITGISSGGGICILYVTNSCGSDTSSKVLTVMPLPDPGTITGADSVCAGASITLTTTVTGGTWSISGSSATVAAGVVTGVAVGTSTVTYSVANYCGTGTRVHSVITNPLPVAGTISGSSAVCESATTTLASTIAGGAWSSSATSIASVDAATGIVAGITAGSATISYTVTNSCGSDVAAYSATVNPLPVAGTISGADSVCLGDTILLTDTVMSGVWSSSDMSIASVTTSGNVIGVATGSAIVTYTVTNSCGTAATNHSVFVKSIADCYTGVKNLTGNAVTISVYPNPTTGSFVIDIPIGATNVLITVTDVTGKTITEMQPKNPSGLKVPVDLQNVARGTYLLKINMDSKLYHDKIIVW